MSHAFPAAASPAKSRGALRLCSSLLRVFFKLNALALANPIFTMLKSLEGVQFPKADEVTLRYYEGRFAVFEEKYVSVRLALQGKGTAVRDPGGRNGCWQTSQTASDVASCSSAQTRPPCSMLPSLRTNV